MRSLPPVERLNAAALAETQQEIPRDPGVPRASRNPKLGRTLRMEIKLGSLPAPGEGEAPPSIRPIGYDGDGNPEQPLIMGSVQRVGERKTGDYVSSRPVLSSTNKLPDFRQPNEFGTSSRFNNMSQPPTAAPRRRRELRPGERTLILTRRKSSKRDWLFVVLLVGALGVIASMLLSYRSSGEDYEETSSDAASEDVPEEETFGTPVAPQQAATPAAESGIKATELRSDPAGAEVAVGGAVVGNTPVRVARSESDVEYTLRLPGYESRIIRVGSQSPAAIAVTLTRKQ